MSSNLFRPLQRLARWFFGSPFEELPTEFGDPVPAELREFERESEQVSHETHTEKNSPQSGGANGKNQFEEPVPVERKE